jgi:uncharacterized protein with PIN domain
MKKSREQIEEELLERISKGVDRVLDWQEEHRTYKFSELEDIILEVRQEIGEAMVEAVVGQMENKHPVDAPYCSTCKTQMEYKGQKKKGIVSRVGEVEIERGTYYCATCEVVFSPSG